ncbi:hypothetical protein T552_00135 [Pneumocystis carinii B80]|uniref:Uncharacterized protein n=1 Tax=Pneumocystis carinii (strain B80) TaxID=1408658 RepID=A0A0W4ZSZ7_PNEC8|nr:hypothetical protein T552_00135 [Pneumocystis carinii B80]KTW31493.1 hypothetical protein T552_00135 [Pneumocystis carinii B80]
MTISGNKTTILSENMDYEEMEYSNAIADDISIKNNHKHMKIFLLIIYPATIVLGILFKLKNGTHDSYFSHSSNIFNVIFAKLGWFWTSLVFMYHISRIQHKNIFKACIRWVFATLWWIFITQWFFGPPIMDRIFILTGGHCKFNDTESNKIATHALYYSSECKLHGGKWLGGYDFSGHAFLLTHASLFLSSELLLTLYSDQKYIKQPQTIIVIALLFLWWFMLLMTACYFHTLMEKVIFL